MNKKLLIAAVGAALVAGPMMAAQAAPTVYGHFHESLDRYDNGGTTERGLLNSNSTRFGIKGDEDLGGGLKAIYQVESGVFNADDGTSGFGNTLRNTYMGFAGSSWGSVKLGRHDAPTKDLSRKLDAFNEEYGDMRVLVGNAAFDNRISNMVRYDSPSFAGVQFALLYGTPEADTTTTTTASTATTNTVTTTANPRTTSANVTWSQGPIWLGLGYEIHAAHNSTAKDPTDLRLAGKFNVTNDFYISALYDTMTDLGTTATNTINGVGLDGNDGKAWSVGAGFKMANNLFKLQYTKADKTDKAVTVGTSNDNGAKLWVVGVDHNLSKSTKVYFDYAKATNGNAATNNISSSYAGHGATNVPTPAAGKSPKGFSLGTIINF